MLLVRRPPEECTRRPFGLGGHRLLDPCGKSRALLEGRDAVYLSVVDRLRILHPNAVFFDARSPFCDETTCYAKEGDEVLYRDGNHLNSVGAEKLMRPLLDLVRALPPTAPRTMMLPG